MKKSITLLELTMLVASLELFCSCELLFASVTNIEKNPTKSVSELKKIYDKPQSSSSSTSTNSTKVSVSQPSIKTVSKGKVEALAANFATNTNLQRGRQVLPSKKMQSLISRYNDDTKKETAKPAVATSLQQLKPQNKRIDQSQQNQVIKSEVKFESRKVLADEEKYRRIFKDSVCKPFLSGTDYDNARKAYQNYFLHRSSLKQLSTEQLIDDLLEVATFSDFDKDIAEICYELFDVNGTGNIKYKHKHVLERSPFLAAIRFICAYALLATNDAPISSIRKILARSEETEASIEICLKQYPNLISIFFDWKRIYDLIQTPEEVEKTDAQLRMRSEAFA